MRVKQKHVIRLGRMIRELDDKEQRLQRTVGDRVKGSQRSVDFQNANSLREIMAFVVEANDALSAPQEAAEWDGGCDCGYGCPPDCGCRHSGEEHSDVMCELSDIEICEATHDILLSDFTSMSDFKIAIAREALAMTKKIAQSQPESQEASKAELKAAYTQGYNDAVVEFGPKEASKVEPVAEGDGFWQWLPKAYRDSDANTAFTAYNMEVAFEAGRAMPRDIEIQAVEELAQIGYTVRDGLLYPPKAGLPAPTQQALSDAKDAARYRWLKAQHEIDDEQASNNNYGKDYPPRTLTVFVDDGEDGLEPLQCDPGALDEHIDAAILAAAGGSEK